MFFKDVVKEKQEMLALQNSKTLDMIEFKNYCKTKIEYNSLAYTFMKRNFF